MSAFRASLPLTNVYVTKTTSLKTSISFICQDFLAQNEGPYSIFVYIYLLLLPVLEK